MKAAHCLTNINVYNFSQAVRCFPFLFNKEERKGWSFEKAHYWDKFCHHFNIKDFLLQWVSHLFFHLNCVTHHIKIFIKIRVILLWIFQANYFKQFFRRKHWLRLLYFHITLRYTSLHASFSLPFALQSSFIPNRLNSDLKFLIAEIFQLR